MNNEEELIHFEKGQIKGYDVDIHQNATIPAMVMMMQESAMQHVLRIGVSAKELVKENLGWVLHQQYFEFFRQPSLGEKLIIQTNPTGLERVFTYRDFQMKDEKGELVAQASSSWILMDTETRKMAKYPTFISEILKPSNDFEKLPRAPRMKFKIEKPDFEKTFQVGFHDLDFNGHLSNFYYFKWMLDSMPSYFLKNNQLQSLQIRFKEECYLDDEVKVLMEKDDENTYVHILLRNEKIMAEGRTVWK